jgi:hypothetical protein
MHAQHDVAAADRFTAVFDDYVTQEPSRRVLLDHVLLSPGFASKNGLRAVRGSGTIHHGDWTALVANGGATREERPKDHRPVSVRLRY